MRFVAGAVVAVLALVGLAPPAGAGTSTGYVIEVRADPYEWRPASFTATVTGGGRTVSTTGSLGSPSEIQASAEPGAYQVTLSGAGLDTTTADFVVSAGAVTSVSVAIHHTTQVRGRVVDDSGAPLSAVWVTLRSSTTGTVGADVRTLRDGTFEMHGVAPGSYDLTNDQYVGYGPIGGTVQITEGGVVELGDVVFTTGTVVTGRVLDAAGAPVVYASVALSQAAPTGGEPLREWHNSAQTDGSGRFRVTGMAPGAIRVDVSADGYFAAQRTVTATGHAAVAGDVRLTATAAIFADPILPGELRAGDPTTTVRAELFTVVGGVRSAKPVASASDTLTVRDQSPDLNFRDLAAGRYVVRMSGSFGALASAVLQRTVEVRAGAYTHVDDVLSFGKPISGRVFQPDGRYGPGLDLVANDVSCTGPLPEPEFPNSAHSTKAGRNGVFSLPSLPGHCYDLGDSGNLNDNPYVTSARRVRGGSSGVHVQKPMWTTLAVDGSTRAYGVRSFDVKVRAVHQAHGVTPVVDDGVVEVFEGTRRVARAAVSDGVARVKFAKALRPGARQFEIRYLRTTAFDESIDFLEIRVAKAPAKVSVDVTKVRRGHASTATVVVRSARTAFGRVDVFVDGTKVRSARVHHAHGRDQVTVTLPKTTSRSASIKVTAKYRGSTTVAAASRSVRVTVK